MDLRFNELVGETFWYQGMDDYREIDSDFDIVIDRFGDLIRSVYEGDEEEGVLSGVIDPMGYLVVHEFNVTKSAKGIGSYMFSEVVNCFDIKKTKSRLVGDNLKVFRSFLYKGNHLKDSLFAMPSVKIRAREGFSSFEFVFVDDKRIDMTAYL